MADKLAMASKPTLGDYIRHAQNRIICFICHFFCVPFLA